MVRQQRQVVRPAALVDRGFQRLMTMNFPHTVKRRNMDHTGSPDHYAARWASFLRRGSLAIAIPVRKENSKVSDHSQIPIELLNEFGNGLATMIPIIKKDT